MLHLDPEQETSTTDIATPVERSSAKETELVEEELLVEEISIDGMCGVY